MLLLLSAPTWMDVEKDPVFNGSSRVMETLVHGFHDSGSGKDPWQGGRTRIKLVKIVFFFAFDSSSLSFYPFMAETLL